MKKNNVFNVLVVNKNGSLLTVNKTIDNLIQNQIGFFDADTNLSLDITKDFPKEFYVAVRNIDNSVKTSVNTITTKLITNATSVSCGNEIPQIVSISDFKAYCGKQYGLRVEFRNSEIYSHYQHNAFAVNYNVETPCCKGCGGECDVVDCNELVKRLFAVIKNDPRELLKVSAYDKATGSQIKYEDLDAFIASNNALPEDKRVCLELRLSPISLGIKKYCSINPKYHKIRSTKMIVSFTEGFDCNGTITEIQEGVPAKGSGYDVRQREYEALGWESNSGTYRISETTMLPNENIVYHANDNLMYKIYNLMHIKPAVGGWQDYTNDIELEIAVECNSNLLPSLDKLWAKLDK